MLGRKDLEEHGLHNSQNVNICFIYDYPSLEHFTKNDKNRKRAEIYRNLGEHFGIPGEFIFLSKLGESNMEEEFDD